MTSAIGNIQGCEADAMRNVGAARQFLDGTPEERQAAAADFAVQLGYEIAVGTCCLFWYIMIVLPLGVTLKNLLFC